LFKENDPGVVIAGVISGVVASLWNFITFFIPVSDLIYLTVPAGILLPVPFVATSFLQVHDLSLQKSRENLLELQLELPDMFR